MEINSMFYNVCEYAAINSASSLSKFTNRIVKLDLKKFEIKSLDEHVINERDRNICIYTPISGDLDGFALFSISKSDAKKLHDSLNISIHSKVNISEHLMSFLSESMNIVIGNFIANIALYLNLNDIKHYIAIHDESPYHEILNKNLFSYRPNDLLIKFNYNFPTINIDCELIYILRKDAVTLALENNLSLLMSGTYE